MIRPQMIGPSDEILSLLTKRLIVLERIVFLLTVISSRCFRTPNGNIMAPHGLNLVIHKLKNGLLFCFDCTILKFSNSLVISLRLIQIEIIVQQQQQLIVAQI